MIPQPSIETQRLFLRPLRMSDETDVFAYASHPRIGPDAGWTPHKSLRDTRRFIHHARMVARNNHPPVYAVIIKDMDTLIGTIQLHSFTHDHKAEVGMVCHPDFQHQGYMKEATKAMLVYAFEWLNLARVGYSHYPHNDASAHLRTSLGFTYEGVLRKSAKRGDGALFDFVVSSFTVDDYHETFMRDFLTFKQTLTFH